MQNTTRDGVSMGVGETVWIVAHGMGGSYIARGRTCVDPRMPTVMFARFGIANSRRTALIAVGMTHACRFEATLVMTAARNPAAD